MPPQAAEPGLGGRADGVAEQCDSVSKAKAYVAGSRGGPQRAAEAGERSDQQAHTYPSQRRHNAMPTKREVDPQDSHRFAQIAGWHQEQGNEPSPQA